MVKQQICKPREDSELATARRFRHVMTILVAGVSRREGQGGNTLRGHLAAACSERGDLSIQYYVRRLHVIQTLQSVTSVSTDSMCT